MLGLHFFCPLLVVHPVNTAIPSGKPCSLCCGFARLSSVLMNSNPECDKDPLCFHFAFRPVSFFYEIGNDLVFQRGGGGELVPC